MEGRGGEERGCGKNPKLQLALEKKVLATAVRGQGSRVKGSNRVKEREGGREREGRREGIELELERQGLAHSRQLPREDMTIGTTLLLKEKRHDTHDTLHTLNPLSLL